MRSSPVTPTRRAAAALLLALQVTAGGAVALVHAADPARGPVAVESRHTAQCIVLHDAARCGQCQYEASRGIAAAKRPVRLPVEAQWRPSPRDPSRHTPTRSLPRGTPPRAPPRSLV
jgi:hypothetical protein